MSEAPEVTNRDRQMVLGWLEPVYQRWLAQRPALL
jgi:hypothetical protein